MGEVYKARDTRLDRTVAVKVLPEHLAQSPERKQRFEREARAISQLNHPHICTLYDVGSQDGIDYLVMEYIEGETLADRLTKGPLALDKALEYGAQIADALDTAHRAGIVHRDLKPANTMLIGSGVKLLDFGLARLVNDESVSATSDAPTRQKDLTQENSIMGTLQYMAPEQLEGKSADRRADVWALGALIYEMVSGEKAFRGQSQASLIAAILDRQPEAMSSLQPVTPPHLERLVERCLAKDPEERWQSARDVALELRWVARHDPAEPISRSAPRPIRMWVTGLAGFVAGALVFGVMIRDAVGPSAAVSRLLLSPQPAREFGDRAPPPDGNFLTRTSIAFSPDGTQLVFVGRREGAQQLYVRSLDRYEAQPLPGTEGATNLFIDPEGEWIGFWANGWLKKIPFQGGSAVNLSTMASVPMGAVWMPEGKIVYANSSGGLFEILATGGSVRQLTTLADDEASHRLPTRLTNKDVMFTVKRFQNGGWDATRIEMLSLDSGERKVLVEEGADARYVVSGHLVYVRMGSLVAATFNVDRLEVIGEPVVILDGVSQSVNAARTGSDSGAGQFAISRAGTLAYLPGGIRSEERRSLVWVDRNGDVEALEAPQRSYWTPRLSPDGNRIAVHAYTNTLSQIWVYDVPRNTLSLLSPETGMQARWTPDGTRLVYASGGLFTDLVWSSADGREDAQRLMQADARVHPGSWTPDGKVLVYSVSSGPSGDSDIYVIEPQGDEESRLILDSPADEYQPNFSPDGRWLAYVSDESGVDEVYVQPFPGPGKKLQISTSGGVSPVWSRDGTELFYRSRALQVMAVGIHVGDRLVASRARALFDDSYIRSFTGGMDVAPDGRFLMVRPQSQERTELYDEVRIVLNWTRELDP